MANGGTPYYPPIIDSSPNIDSRDSAAIPTFVVVIANLNSARMGAAKRPLSSLNPWLYDSHKALTDAVDECELECDDGLESRNRIWARRISKRLCSPRSSVRTCVLADLSVLGRPAG